MTPIGELALLAVVLILIIDRAWERHQTRKRERDLLNRIMSRDLPEYALATKAIETSARDDIRAMEIAKEDEESDDGIYPIDH